MANFWKKSFRVVMGVTGLFEAIMGIVIVLFAGTLQHYFATGILSEPLYLRILGMMDSYIGVTYFQIARNPTSYLILNRRTSYLRLGLSALFFVEGFFLLEERGLRIMYQSLAAFDFSLFVIQTLYIKKSSREGFV